MSELKSIPLITKDRVENSTGLIGRELKNLDLIEATCSHCGEEGYVQSASFMHAMENESHLCLCYPCLDKLTKGSGPRGRVKMVARSNIETAWGIYTRADTDEDKEWLRRNTVLALAQDRVVFAEDVPDEHPFFDMILEELQITRSMAEKAHQLVNVSFDVTPVGREIVEGLIEIIASQIESEQRKVEE